MALTQGTMGEVVRRVNCYGVGPWLGQVLADLGLAFPIAPAVLPRSAGPVLKLGAQVPASPSQDRRDAVFVSPAEGNDTVPPPLGLDPKGETIDTARQAVPIDCGRLAG